MGKGERKRGCRAPQGKGSRAGHKERKMCLLPCRVFFDRKERPLHNIINGKKRNYLNAGDEVFRRRGDDPGRKCRHFFAKNQAKPLDRRKNKTTEEIKSIDGGKGGKKGRLLLKFGTRSRCSIGERTACLACEGDQKDELGRAQLLKKKKRPRRGRTKGERERLWPPPCFIRQGRMRSRFFVRERERRWVLGTL